MTNHLRCLATATKAKMGALAMTNTPRSEVLVWPRAKPAWLGEYREAFRKGAMLARVYQRPNGFEYVDSVSEEEKEVLRREISKRWSQPFMLYFLVVLCAGSAIVQGMDQTSVNGAQVRLFWPYARSKF